MMGCLMPSRKILGVAKATPENRVRFVLSDAKNFPDGHETT